VVTTAPCHDADRRRAQGRAGDHPPIAGQRAGQPDPGEAWWNSGTIVHAALTTDFGIEKPRIAFTGLNPHAGEGGAIGREEIEIINPAAATLRSRNIDISNARPGDTVFAEALSGAYDAVIAMTHDQGLIPVKTLDFWGGVNMTLGLPIVRTSPTMALAMMRPRGHGPTGQPDRGHPVCGNGGKKQA
jgi:hypothetical protein